MFHPEETFADDRVSKWNKGLTGHGADKRSTVEGKERQKRRERDPDQPAGAKTWDIEFEGPSQQRVTAPLRRGKSRRDPLPL